MTFRESVRCPQCLTLGEMRAQFGNYVCDKCDRVFGPDTLTHFMNAFNKGRKFERENPLVN